MQIPEKYEIAPWVPTEEYKFTINKIIDYLEHQKNSQSSWECNHSFDSALMSNPPIYVCSKCWFQKRERQSSLESEDKPITNQQDFWWIKKIADSYIQEFMVQFDNWRKPRCEVKDKVLTRIINDNS
jgi:hypothetical protein